MEGVVGTVYLLLNLAMIQKLLKNKVYKYIYFKGCVCVCVSFELWWVSCRQYVHQSRFLISYHHTPPKISTGRRHPQTAL